MCLKTGWTLDYPLEDDEVAAGELVFLTRADNSAGPLAPERSQALLSAIDAAGRAIELEDAVATLLAPRRSAATGAALILPAPTFESELSLRDDHPLHGVPYGNVVEALKRVEDVAAPEIITLLSLCRDERIVLSVGE